MVFYFVTRALVPGSLLQRFVDGDDEFRNSRLKLIPSVPKVDVYNEVVRLFIIIYVNYDLNDFTVCYPVADIICKVMG